MKCKFYHVDCVIGGNSFLRNCSIEAKQKNGKLEIGANCLLENTVFGFYGIGAKIVVKNDVRINARPKAKTYLFVKGNSRIVIDEGCSLSNSIEISTTDWHSVIDEQGKRINHEKDVYIGKLVGLAVK